MLHNLKTLPEYFQAISRGYKTFEIRKNDRDFKVGDGLCLNEWTGSSYTGDFILAQITYITDYEQKENFVVMGIIILGDYLGEGETNK